jgi:hypothetical protein
MATLAIGPNILVVKSPNNNEGINKMILTIAFLMVRIITNPFTNAYFQGDVVDPLEID